MCGIAGFFKTTREPFSVENDQKLHDIMTKIFDETKSRGSDASGFSYLNEYRELKTVKGPIASSDMIKEDKWLKLAGKMPQSMIMHCRAWTKGEPINNFNNHPILTAKEIALVHNGCISNDDDIKKECLIAPKGEVDTEAIPLSIHTKIYEQLDKDEQVNPVHIIKAINETAKSLYGGYACAMLNKQTPDFLYLFDHTNPIVLAYVPELDVVIFASEERFIKEGFEKHLKVAEKKNLLYKLFSFKEADKPRYAIEKIADNTIIVIGIVDKEVDGVVQPVFDIMYYDMDSNFSRTKNTSAYIPPHLNKTIIDGVVITENGVSDVVKETNYLMPKRKLTPGYTYSGGGTYHSTDDEDWRQAYGTV